MQKGTIFWIVCKEFWSGVFVMFFQIRVDGFFLIDEIIPKIKKIFFGSKRFGKLAFFFGNIDVVSVGNLIPFIIVVAILTAVKIPRRQFGDFNLQKMNLFGKLLTSNIHLFK